MDGTLRNRLIGAAAGGVMMLAMVLVGTFEGRNLVPYLDPVAIPTVCVGHTGNVRLDHVYSDADCDELLRSDLGKALAAVDRNVKVPLPAMTRAALGSFVFNVGEGKFRSSNLLRRLNNGAGASACAEMKRWVYAGKKRLDGLVRRREAEAALCVAGFKGGAL